MARARRAWFWLLKKTLNRGTLRLARAGHGPFSLVRHVGRSSGRRYETPLIVARVPAGFVAELTYGDAVDWYRNVLAAGGGELVVRGETYPIVGVERYPTDRGRRAFALPARLVLTVSRRDEYRLLRTG